MASTEKWLFMSVTENPPAAKQIPASIALFNLKRPYSGSAGYLQESHQKYEIRTSKESSGIRKYNLDTSHNKI